MNSLRFTALAALALVASCTAREPAVAKGAAIDWREEVIYHVFPRSFYDSNGDRHGDLNGVVEKLDYLQKLGVTTILFTPLYASDFYHNYFPSDYESIDPEYGTMDEYLAFVESVHARGMKFIMDMETQYAPEGHPWFDDSFGNPSSPYSNFISYSDEANELPDQFYISAGAPLHRYPVWPDKKLVIANLDLNHATVKSWMSDFFVFWVDPNGDGDFSDGVDGFRIDHIMDDLDDRGTFLNLYEDLWAPIFDRCRSLNPDLFIVGEQADWGSTGADMVARSGADASFHFALHAAISAHEGQDGELFDIGRIVAAVAQSLEYAPAPPYVVNFVENHDTTRIATLVAGEDGPLRAAAALNLLLPGIPSIYYGQELGMTGRKLKDIEPASDGVDIPKREAFAWSADINADGMSAWYRDSGPWWDRSMYHDVGIEQIAWNAQRDDPDSLWNYYRQLIDLRKTKDTLSRGDFQVINDAPDGLLAFTRSTSGQTTMVLINLVEHELQYDGIVVPAWSYSVSTAR